MAYTASHNNNISDQHLLRGLGLTHDQRRETTYTLRLLLLPTKEEVMRLPAFVCLSVSVRLLKNECMDLDEMLRFDRCRDMDELINF